MVLFGIEPGASSHPASGPAAERPYVRCHGVTVSEFVALAKRHPPRCLASYSVIPDPSQVYSWSGGDSDFAVSFAVRCKCGSSTLILVGIPDDEMGLYGPITTRCPACSAESLLFDVDQFGYDSEFGHGTGYKPPVGGLEQFVCNTCKHHQFETHPWFTYQFESLDEFDDLAPLLIPNYFDTFGIDLRCNSCAKWCSIASYECT